jgi:hypothetical protein
VGPSIPGDPKPTTPGATPRMPGSSAPSASPSTIDSGPATKGDSAGGGWSKYTSRGFTNESESLSWLDKQGK